MTGSEAEGATVAEETPIQELLRQRLIICLGSGGVGKTTVAAGLGLAAARMGRRSAVITVDPARRLKDALGLEDLSIDPQPVCFDGVETGLDALALDTKRVFDALIDRVSPTPEVAQRIQANRLYQECCRSRENAEIWTAAETARNRDGLMEFGVQPSRFRSDRSVPVVA